jgi:hypothetical protein
MESSSLTKTSLMDIDADKQEARADKGLTVSDLEMRLQEPYGLSGAADPIAVSVAGDSSLIADECANI